MSTTDLSLLQGQIRETQKYFEYFDFPVSPEEMWFYLHTSKPVSYQAVASKVALLSEADRSIRQDKTYIATHKLTQARHIIRFISFFPTILFVGLTGSLSVNNGRSDDDVDLFIVTRPHTLWITRMLVSTMLLISGSLRTTLMPGRTRDTICANIWLDYQAIGLSQHRANIYTAHELLQMRPLFDRYNIWSQILKKNSWVKTYLYHGYGAQLQSSKVLSTSTYKPQPLLLILIAPLNLICYILQFCYMIPKITTEKVSYQSAFFHNIDRHASIVSHLSSHKK
jgi:hypothetical protein